VVGWGSFAVRAAAAEAEELDFFNKAGRDVKWAHPPVFMDMPFEAVWRQCVIQRELCTQAPRWVFCHAGSFESPGELQLLIGRVSRARLGELGQGGGCALPVAVRAALRHVCRFVLPDCGGCGGGVWVRQAPGPCSMCGTVQLSRSGVEGAIRAMGVVWREAPTMMAFAEFGRLRERRAVKVRAKNAARRQRAKRVGAAAKVKAGEHQQGEVDTSLSPTGMHRTTNISECTFGANEESPRSGGGSTATATAVDAATRQGKTRRQRRRHLRSAKGERGGRFSATLLALGGTSWRSMVEVVSQSAAGDLFSGVGDLGKWLLELSTEDKFRVFSAARGASPVIWPLGACVVAGSVADAFGHQCSWVFWYDGSHAQGCSAEGALSGCGGPQQSRLSRRTRAKEVQTVLDMQEAASSPGGNWFYFWLMSSDAQATVAEAMETAARATDYTAANGAPSRASATLAPAARAAGAQHQQD